MATTIWATFFEEELGSLADSQSLRELRMLPATGGEIDINGRVYLNFSSNDYLNLARDTRLQDAAAAAVAKLGCSATASRLMAGHLELHEQLEIDLARMVGTKAALVFGSGFLTNLGVLSTVAKAGDFIFSDRLNHASLIDGTRLSRARCYPYHHKDMMHLETLLKRTPASGKRVIVSESVFSMDGDIAPLPELAYLANRYGALLVVDEAHAIGLLGKNGGGVCRVSGRVVYPDIIIGTLSKALGGYGGFVGCSTVIRQFLVNHARSFIYSTGLPPACLGSAQAAVAIVMSEPGLGHALLDKTKRFRDSLVSKGLRLPEFNSPILPILVGGNEATLGFAKLLESKGLLVRAVRPPTVPVGTSRLRLSITLSLSDAALEKAAAIIAAAADEAGISQID